MQAPTHAILDLDLGEGDLYPGREGERLLAVLNRRGCRCVIHSGLPQLFEAIARFNPNARFVAKPACPERVVDALVVP